MHTYKQYNIYTNMHVCFYVYDMKAERRLWKWRKGSIGSQRVEQLNNHDRKADRGTIFREEGDSQNKRE